MKTTAILSTIALALAFAAPMAEAKGRAKKGAKAPAVKAVKGKKTSTGHHFPSRAPKGE